MSKNLKIKLFIIILAPITWLSSVISKSHPGIVEKYYSTGLNKPIRQALSKITGLVPFSAAEILIFMLVLGLVVFTVRFIISFFKGKPVQSTINLITYLAALYIFFMVLWGFNYNRVSFDRLANLQLRKSSVEELYDLCKSLALRANELRSHVNENDTGVMTLEDKYKGAFKRAEKGYLEASKFYKELEGRYGIPKPILLSKKLSYTGITGIYIPYTGEANVNTNITDFMLPATAAHEMAHQRGFAREDEANYIAYLTCTKNPDTDFQYSGIMLALIYAGNALADVSPEYYRELGKLYSEGVRRDLTYDYEFWQQYKGKAEEISNNINNTYLKSNGQEDGVKSYGRMVDLLLAERRKELEISN
jgi:hypothetical protein